MCPLTHAKGKKKTLTHFVPTHSPRTPPQLSTSPTSIAAATLSSTAVVGGRSSRSKQHGISPLPLSTAYLHRHSRLWSIGVFCGIGPGILLMEKVINLAKYSLISYRSPSVAVNQPAEIRGCSFMCPQCEHKSGKCDRGQSETKFYLTIPDDFRQCTLCSIPTYHGRHGLNL